MSMTYILGRMLQIGVIGLVMAASTQALAQADIKETSDAQTLYVNVESAAASDESPGTETQPLKSIGKALQLAQANESGGRSTRIVVFPGAYREQLSLVGDKDERSKVLTIIEASEKGKTIITGSDRWDGWQRDGEGGVYVHEWKERFAPAQTPESWKKSAPLKGLATRREVVFVDGKLLRQVLKREEMKVGTFCVDETEDKIRIWPAAGTNMETARVEVAMRPALLRAQGKRGLVLRGLTFRHANSTIIESAALLRNCQNVLIEGCLFEWNNGIGLQAQVSSEVTVRRVLANDNGSCGFESFRLYDYLVEDVEASRNNWRGAWGEFYGWAQAGAKHLGMHRGIYRRFKAVDNLTRGFWFDFDCADIVMDEIHLCGNLTDGINIEANQGPITIRNSTMGNNGRIGVSIWNSSHVTLENNILYGNGKTQLVAIGKDRPIKDHETDEAFTVSTDYLVLKDNVLAAHTPIQGILDVDGEDFLIKTLKAERNLYFVPKADNGFVVAKQNLSFAEWQLVTEQDATSIYADPRLAKAETGDFTPLPDSPLKTKDKWAVRTPGTKTGGDLLKERRQAEIRRTWETLYPLAAGAAESEWTLIDLKTQANRALTGTDAWIGMPLEHLEAGKKMIHGVPFEIIDQQKNGGAAVLMLRSAQLSRSKDKTFDSQVKLPLGRQAKAVYILHGCGWGGNEPRKVGQYRLVYEDGTHAAVDVRIYGNGGGSFALVDDAAGEANMTRIAKESNLQDWWPTFKHFNNDHARMVIVPQGSSPMAAYRYLYTMEIPNPHPEKRIAEIQLESDPTLDTTLIVLAVTALNVP